MKKLPIVVLKDEKAPVFVLMSLVLNTYGTICMSWAPEILKEEIKEDFGVELSGLQSDKIQAGFSCLVTNLFEEQWEVFKTICHLLNNTPDNFEDFTSLEAEELATALGHYSLIQPETAGYSDEIRAYVGLILYHYGMSEPANIFLTAIMPDEAVKSDPTEKNEALNSLFDEKIKSIKEYMASVELI